MYGYAPFKETDESLRARLFYVCGRDGRIGHSIETAAGPSLDLIADEYGLKRR